MTIDPDNLGPPVYKDDQVITEDDLQYLFECYKHNEDAFMGQGMMKEASTCCVSHQVISALQEWLRSGKERGEMNYGDDAWFS